MVDWILWGSWLGAVSYEIEYGVEFVLCNVVVY